MSTTALKDSKLNSTQLMLLQTFSGVRDENEMEEISVLLRNYYAKKLNDAIDRLYEDGTLTEAKLDEWRLEHNRTPYGLQ